jgi:glycosyltransferase involved in cell wall biosynthesis
LEVTSALRGPAGEKPTVVIAGRVVPDEEVLDEGISHVEDAGYITDATEYARLLRSLDLLVVPSRSEGRARAIEDALIVGTPVVASQNAGFRPGEARGVDILDDRNLAMWCSELGWVFDAAERRARRLEALAGGQDYFDLYEEPELTLGRAISRLL